MENCVFSVLKIEIFDLFKKYFHNLKSLKSDPESSLSFWLKASRSKLTTHTMSTIWFSGERYLVIRGSTRSK